MRCTGCGLPLSPQRTHCPRCGIVVGASGKQEEQVNNQVGVPQLAFSTSQESNTIAASAETVQGQSASIAQQQASYQMPDQEQNFLSHPEQSPSWQSSFQANQKSTPLATISPGEFQPLSPLSASPQTHSRPKVQPGFTIAGLCVLAGGLILMLVYIISLNLPVLPTSNQSTSTQATNTPVAQNVAPGTQGGLPTNVTPTSSSTTATSTPVLPGKTYIDSAQMSGNVDANTALSSQTTTTFTVHQKIFVTFMLHSPSSGAVCLLWYVNQQQFSQFAFPVDAMSAPQHAYSFAYAYTAGQGSVNIYWASSTACSDKLLAQTASFTVNP